MANKNEAKIKFTAETKEFNSQIKSANGSLQELRSELKLNSEQMKTAGNSAELLKERQAILRKELEASESKTAALSDKLDAAKRIYGENSEEVKKLQTQLNNAQSAEEAIRRDIQQTNDSLDKQKISLESVSQAAENVGDKLTNAGKKMSVVSAGIVGAGAASVAAFNAVDEGADNALKATGATGEAAAELEESYKKVSQSIVGDFGVIGSTLGEVNTRFGFTGEKAETATTKFMKFSEVTGMDATEAVKAVSRAIESAGMDTSEYGTLLDSLTAAGQATGISVDTLATSLTDNGATMREMGYDTNTTIAMLAQFEKAGVDSNAVVRGMRTAMSSWAKDGLDAKTEFANLVQGIKDGSVDAGAAYEVFGSKAGTELIDAIKSGRFEYEDMIKVVEGSKGALEGTFDSTIDGGYEMDLAMQNAKVAMAEVGNTLATSLAPVVETAAEKLKGFASWWSNLDKGTQNTILTIAGVVAAIGPVLLILGQVASAISKITNVMNIMKNSTLLATIATKAQAAAQWLLNAAMNANPITLVVVAIVALIAIFAVLWNKCEGFRNFWIGLWEGIKKACSAAWDGIKKACSAAWDGIKAAWSGAGKWFSGVWKGIQNAFSNVGSWFKSTFSKAKDGAVNSWSNTKEKFTDVKNGIVSAFSNVKEKLSAPFTKARDAIKKVADKIKGFFKGEIKMPKIKMPHFGISPKGWKIGDLLKGSIPKLKIDWYAKAMSNPMILSKPTIFGSTNGRLMGGGEAGSEMIGGTNTVMRMIQNAVDKSVRTSDIYALAATVEELANRPIELNIDGKRFAYATASATDSVGGIRNTLKSRGLVLD